MLPIQTWGASSATHGPSLGAQGGTRCWSSGAMEIRLWILFDEFLFRFLAGVGWLDLGIITVYWSPVKSILSSCTCYRKDLQSWMSSSFARWGELLMFWHFWPSEDIESWTTSVFFRRALDIADEQLELKRERVTDGLQAMFLRVPPCAKDTLPPIKMDPSNSNYLSNTAIFHFHDYGGMST